ncbi:MAG: hypothetical protein AMJ54_15625 [Deltaproteobacteria bacterium SG8_13]|nr:MAG: hypothetical protein AMJ54_15625 [Deltaproteobacteria bacterium SG8_13]
MIISINRPYFAPYPGFFQKADLSDVLVLLDRVQFPRSTTWITRNRFKNDQGALWVTVPVFKKHLGLQPIDQVRINHETRWARKFLLSLESAYAHAPYFRDHHRFLADLLSQRQERILDLNIKIVQYLLGCLKISTPVRLQSDLQAQGKGDGLLVDVCRRAGADVYLAQREVEKFIDQQQFEKAGIQLKYFTASTPVYPQLWGEFLFNLSAFDLLFNCGPKAREILLADGA